MSLLLVIPGVVLALLTLASSVAAVFRVGRLKSALETSERAAEAWKEERDAAIAKAERVSGELALLTGRVKELEDAKARLEERTDLTRYFDQQDKNHREVVDELHGLKDGFKTLATSIEVLAVMLRPLTAAQ